MDFSYSDDQLALFGLAQQILIDKASHARVKQIEKSGGPRFDRELWSELAKAGLLGAALPVEHGGSGLGFLEVTGIAEQIGRATAPVPYFETIVLGALAIAEFGSAAQREQMLPRVARGELILSAALTEAAAAPLDPPQTRAQRNGGQWTVSGTKMNVPAGQLAERILLPASTGDGEVVLLLLDPKQAGVTITELDTTSGQPEARIDLHNTSMAATEMLGAAGQGSEIVAWIEQRATAALCATALGVCTRALELTAEYLKTRKQFDQPIGMFQAAGHRAADAYIDTEGVRLTAMQAAWRIAAGLPAEKQVHVAKCWAADGGKRVVHAAQHLHGGIGVDRDYPLHRYFLYARQLELTLGGATHHYRALGALLANEPM
ncbi:MAG TPA: acyl-CoA dehydrogenase family protein [Terriglobales bacterium]|nr:acyl-CoA dehydrogenase family protein [Terriglobales bacterium]